MVRASPISRSLARSIHRSTGVNRQLFRFQRPFRSTTMSQRTLRIGLFLMVVLTNAAVGSPDDLSFHAGTWNATTYGDWNLTRHHPLTVALRVEVMDADTRVPIESVEVRVEGRFREDPSERFQDPLNQPDEKDFRLIASTGKDGIAVLALSWQDEKLVFQDAFGFRTLDKYVKDDLFKIQTVMLRKDGYRVASEPITWFKEFDVRLEDLQDFDRFSRTESYVGDGWLGLIDRVPNAKCVLIRSPDGFPRSGERSLADPLFFEKVRQQDYSKVFDGSPKRDSNLKLDSQLQKWADHLGPYIVLPIRVELSRTFQEIKILPQASDPSPSITQPNSTSRPENRDQEAEPSRHTEVLPASKTDHKGSAPQTKSPDRPPPNQTMLVEKAKAHPLGMAVETLTGETRAAKGLFIGTRGVLVQYVLPGSRASRSGIEPDMVIESIGHQSVINETEFNEKLRGSSQPLLGFWRRQANEKWERGSTLIAPQ